MNNAIEELKKFVRRKNTAFSKYVALDIEKSGPTIQDELVHFLSTTMDQVRVNKALDCTRRVLAIADLEDFEMFREGVWKREATRGMAYDKQRDHTAHTLNNWLLGWYFYSHSDRIYSAINTAIERRDWNPSASHKFSFDQYFGHTWQYTSLLHDIGYLFEGSITSMDTGNQSKQAEIGLRTADEYFTMAFWKQTGATSVHAHPEFRKLVSMPDAPQEASLSKIAIYLRALGRLNNLAKEVAADLQHSAGKRRSAKLELPGDAFDLWQAHFKHFGQADAAQRIEDLQAAFLEDVTKGMPGADIRVLDHGVCSGLLQLKIATFFYNLFANFDNLEDDGGEYSPAAVAAKMRAREDTVAVPHDYEFWWSGIVWASASAALHNIQQRGERWASGVKGRTLALADEPLTYLGILVDCIQDWDRYFVYDSRTRNPVQGIEVDLGHEQGKIMIKVPAPLFKKMTEDLDKALSDWTEIVTLTSK
ncbi:hypothetical protein [Cupriavidus necator]|uniref:hypothetical protein n=1 Tax=Cupriavidus necator TaxID=106590 RepID=UPI0005B3CA5B|nr:hypothetical protein [Cupriavidus necator]